MKVRNSRIAFLLLILFFTAAFSVSSVITYITTKNRLNYELVHSSLPLLSESIYSGIQRELSMPLNVASAMARDSFLINWVLDDEKDSGMIRQYLANLRDKYNFFTSFFVSGQTGNYYYYEGILKQINKEDEHDSWFFRFTESGNEVDLDVDTNEAADGVLTVFINYRLEDFSGNYLGVVGVGLRLDKIASMLAEKQEMYDRVIYLVGEDGIIQIHSDMSKIENINVRETQGIRDVADKLMVQSEAPRDASYILNNRHILVGSRFISELGWYVFVEQDETSSLSGARRNLIVNLVLIAVVAVLLFFASSKVLLSFEKRMEGIAGTDNLTRTANRRELIKQYDLFLYRQQRYNSSLSLILLDLDNFKLVNDQYGHLSGDELLLEVSKEIRRNIRPTDLLARWGGDEFIILMEAGKQQALDTAERIRLEIQPYVQERFKEIRGKVSLSIGVAGYCEGDTLDELIKRADIALYSSKQTGRNKTTVASDCD